MMKLFDIVKKEFYMLPDKVKKEFARFVNGLKFLAKPFLYSVLMAIALVGAMALAANKPLILLLLVVLVFIWGIGDV